MIAKKLLLLVIAVITGVILAVYCVFVAFAPNALSDKFMGIKNEKSTVTVDDNEFLFRYRTGSGLVMVKLYVNNSKTPLYDVSYRTRTFDFDSKLEKLFSDKTMNVYKSYDKIIYEIGGRFRVFNYEYYSPDVFESAFPEEERENVLKIMQLLISSGDSDSYRYYSEVLNTYSDKQ